MGAQACPLTAMGTAASMPREVTVSSEYKVAAEEYKAYLLTLGEAPKSARSHLRHQDCVKADKFSKWEVERRASLAQQRREMLAHVRQSPFRPTVVVRPRAIAVESS